MPSSRLVYWPQVAQRSEQQRVGAEQVELVQVAVRAPACAGGGLAENVGLDCRMLVRPLGSVGRDGVEERG